MNSSLRKTLRKIFNAEVCLVSSIIRLHTIPNFADTQECNQFDNQIRSRYRKHSRRSLVPQYHAKKLK